METRLNRLYRLAIWLSLPFLLHWEFHWFEPAAQKNSHGIKAYEKKDFKESLRLFLEARGLKEDDRLIHNTAATLYQMEDYQKALNEFSKIEPEKGRIPEADRFYNLGNVLYRLEKYDQALEAYKKSLMHNPHDLAAKKNYELTLQKIENRKKSPDPEQRDRKDPQKKQENRQPEKKYQNLMKFLNQNEREQLKNKKTRAKASSTGEEDW